MAGVCRGRSWSEFGMGGWKWRSEVISVGLNLSMSVIVFAL